MLALILQGEEIREELMKGYPADTRQNSPEEQTGEGYQEVSDSDERAEELTEKEKELLLSIWEYPLNGTVQKFKRIGVSRRQGQKLRQGLIQRGLIKKVPCRVPEGQVVLIEVTKKGRQVLREMGINTDNYNPREGGAVHRYWCERVAQEYRDKGSSVEKEVTMGDRIIDVVATNPDGKKVGIEIIRKNDSCDVVEEKL